MRSDGRSWSAGWRALIPGPAVVLALGLALPIALSPVKTHDLFFHLAGARWWLAHGFPPVDPFSVTASAGWVPHEWGFGVIAELLSRVLGGAGIELLIAALLCGTVLALWGALGATLRERGLGAVALLAVTLFVQSFTWPQERPYHLGHLLFALTVLAVQRWKVAGRGQRAYLLLIPLTAVWANLHGSWLLGPVYAGATAFGAAVDGWSDPAARRRAGTALGLAAVAFLAAGLSPTGVHVYLYPLQHATLQSTQGIVEWRPLDLQWPWARAHVLLIFVAGFALGRAPRLRIASVLPALGLTVASLGAQRHAPFAAMLLMVVIAEHLTGTAPLAVPEALGEAWGRIEGAVARWSHAAHGGVALLGVLVTLAVVAVVRPVPVREAIARDQYPLSAIDRLRTLPPGKVLNYNTFGGLISYLAGPDYKVFIDTRNDPFPLAIHQDYEACRLAGEGWREALHRYDPDYILWKTEPPFDLFLTALAQDGGWTPLVTDATGALWVRRAQ